VAASLVSLIIPTYRRPADVLRCLESVQAQALEQFEIVVVDNAADGSLRDQVADLSRNSARPLRYVPEPALGLHNARHAGVRAARGDVLIFTDDDATFDSHWLAAYADAFDAHPSMAAAGGPVRPVWETQPPRWLLDFMRLYPGMFPILSLMEPFQEFRLAADGLFFGVNMAVRRDALIDSGGFNPDSFGRYWLGDGETGLNRSLWRRGALIGYVPEAVVFHHVPPERMTTRYFRRRQANDGAADMYARFHPNGKPSLPALLRATAEIVAGAARDWVALPLFWDRTEPRALRVQMRATRAWAQLTYVLRLIVDPELRTLVARRDWLSSATAAAPSLDGAA
jgi:glycosyltransferase involved in cell wall biosynthesis